MEKNNLDSKEELEAQMLSDHRALDRYVWYQIRSMIKNDLQLGRIINIDERGILGVNPNTKLLTEDQIKEVSKLINNHRDGIYRNNQFKDLDEPIKDRYSYRMWFENKAMNSFMQTIPTKEVFYTQPQDLNAKLKSGQYSYDEINRESFSGYSIWQTMYALEFINPFLVAMLLGHDNKIEYELCIPYMGFKYESDTYFYVRLNSINIYTKGAGGFKAMDDITIHSFLFEHYKEPIYQVINSIMEPIGGSRVLPNEGLKNCPMDVKITHDVYQILGSDNYHELDKKYELTLPHRHWL